MCSNNFAALVLPKHDILDQLGILVDLEIGNQLLVGMLGYFGQLMVHGRLFVGRVIAIFCSEARMEHC